MNFTTEKPVTSGLNEKANAVVAAVRDELAVELAKLQNPSRDTVNQLLEPHSKLKRLAKLFKKADELALAALMYTDPCQLEKPKKKKEAA